MDRQEQSKLLPTRDGLQFMLSREIAKHYLQNAGVELILKSFSKVDRKTFVPSFVLSPYNYPEYIYSNEVLPIEQGKSSMSQPTLIAAMLIESGITDQIERKKGILRRGKELVQVLEIGTASGFSTAVTASIDTKHINIDTVEIDPQLVEHATQKLINYPKVHVYQAVPDVLGVPSSNKKYDVIISTVGFSVVPDALLDKLNDGGKLVIPVKNQIIIATREGENFSFRIDQKNVVNFVPVQEMSTQIEGRKIDPN